MIFFRLLSKLPLWFLYVISDVFYFLTYYIIGYRKDVVLQNLQKSFPEKSEQELHIIRKHFYQHLADLFVETIKILSLSANALEKRFTVVNIEALKTPLDNGKSVIVLTSHQANWEWLSLITSLKTNYPIDAVYQPLRNKFFDKLMLKIRERYTIVGVKMQNILREVIKNRNEAHIIALLADQSPSGSDKDFWTTFMHQETCFFIGGEKMALKMGYPVVFGGARKIKRGYYELYFENIAVPPYENVDEGYITEQYVQKLETQIRQNPPYWLWSHKRWKRKRNS